MTPTRRRIILLVLVALLLTPFSSSVAPEMVNGKTTLSMDGVSTPALNATTLTLGSDVNLSRDSADLLELEEGDRLRLQSTSDGSGTTHTALLEVRDYRDCSQCYGIDVKKYEAATTPSASRAAFVVHNYQGSTGTYEPVVVIDSTTPATHVRLRNAYNAERPTPGPGTGSFLVADADDGTGYITEKLKILDTGRAANILAWDVYNNLTQSAPHGRYANTYLQWGDGTTLDTKVYRLRSDTVGIGTGDSLEIVSGALKIGSSSLPTCDSSTRFEERTVAGGAGVADQRVICLKSATDTYSWITIATG